MLRSTSFLIKSDRHFRTNRNVNETEKKIGCSNTRKIYSGIHLVSCEPALG